MKHIVITALLALVSLHSQAAEQLQTSFPVISAPIAQVECMRLQTSGLHKEAAQHKCAPSKLAGELIKPIQGVVIKPVSLRSIQ